MAFDIDEALGIPKEVTATPKPTFDLDESLGLRQGGLVASVKKTVGQTIAGAGQLAADFVPGVSQDNALKQYGQEVVEANPTKVNKLGDVLTSPGTAVAEAVGNAAPSIGGMLGLRALGQGITLAAPLAGPAAPLVAGLGQAVSWGGPLVAAALPSYGGIRDEQIKADPESEKSWQDKAVSLLGAGAVGYIEQRFGPQDWAAKLVTKEGRDKIAAMMASETFKGQVIKGGLKGAAVEGGEELVQNPIEQLAAYQTPTTKENLEETAFGGVMGALGGGVLGGGFGAASRTMGPEKESDPITDKIIKTTTENITGGTVEKTDDGIKVTTADGAEISGDPETIADRIADKGTIEPTDDELRQELKLGGQDGQVREGRQTPLDEQSTPDASTQSAPTGVTSTASPNAINESQTPLSVTGETQPTKIINYYDTVFEEASKKKYALHEQAVPDGEIVGFAPASIAAKGALAHVDPEQLQVTIFPARMDAAAKKIAKGTGLPVQEVLPVLYDEVVKHEKVHLQQHMEFRTTPGRKNPNSPTEVEAYAKGSVSAAIERLKNPQQTNALQAQANGVAADNLGPVQPAAVADGEQGPAPAVPNQDFLFSQQRMPWEPEGPVQPKEVVDQIVAQADPTVTYGGVMPGTDLHQFVTTLPDGREANFPIKGEVTPERIAEEKAKAASKFLKSIAPGPDDVELFTTVKGKQTSAGVVPKKSLQDIKVTVNMLTENNRVVEIQQPAEQVLADIDEEISLYEKIKECVG